jgi:hypothetical protein
LFLLKEWSQNHRLSCAIAVFSKLVPITTQDSAGSAGGKKGKVDFLHAIPKQLEDAFSSARRTLLISYVGSDLNAYL